MYILCTKREKIRLKPDKLGKDYKSNIKRAIYDTYLFKVSAFIQSIHVSKKASKQSSVRQ